MRPRVVYEPEAADLVRGATVAVVGNASSALAPAWDPLQGRKIDGHELVVRLNAGVPGPEHYAALGQKTDILMAGNIAVLKDSLGRLEVAPEQIWFVKPTRLGEREWLRLAEGEVALPCPIWRYPPHRISELHGAMGSPPSGGACAIWFLRQSGADLRLYGFDWFATPTWWHEQRPAAKIGGPFKHDGANERRFFQEMGVVAR